MQLRYKPSARAAEYLNKLTCGHWEDTGKLVGSHIGIIRHRQSGQTVTYELHAGGNDSNSARNMAAEISRVCGCRLIEARGRKRSRKAIHTSGFSLDVARQERQAHHRADAKAELEEAQARAIRADLAELADAIRNASRTAWERPSTRAYFDRLRAEYAAKLNEFQALTK